LGVGDCALPARICQGWDSGARGARGGEHLAGVPSIVFGVFGLGFFVYAVGGTIDQLFYSSKLPTPLTAPAASSGPPSHWRCSRCLWWSWPRKKPWPPCLGTNVKRAWPWAPPSGRPSGMWCCRAPRRAFSTGLILAMSRGAGEVAPLMLTGVVKLAPSMPLDGSFPLPAPGPASSCTWDSTSMTWASKVPTARPPSHGVHDGPACCCSSWYCSIFLH